METPLELISAKEMKAHPVSYKKSIKLKENEMQEGYFPCCCHLAVSVQYKLRHILTYFFHNEVSQECNQMETFEFLLTLSLEQNSDAVSFGSVKPFSATEKGRICCKGCPGCVPCTRRCICVTAVGLGVCAVIITIIAVVAAVGIPPRTPVNRLCIASNNQTGFLCDNRDICIPASQVCNTRKNCPNGEDEENALCSDLPNNLPEYLIFYCSNPRFWIYADKRCNGINDCGDCSDEIGAWASCPPCGPHLWQCTIVVFHMYCDCIPRVFCRDGIQHCFDWSDEYVCTR